MQTKKQKAGKKQAFSKPIASRSPAKSVKSSGPTEGSFSLKVIAVLLYGWAALIAYYIFFQASQVLSAINVYANDADMLNQLLILAVAVFVMVLSFRTATDLMKNDDDAYLSAVILLLNIAAYGLTSTQILNNGVINVVPMLFVMVAILGLALLLPLSSRMKAMKDHSLSVWAMILAITYWFSVLFVAPWIASAK